MVRLAVDGVVEHLRAAILDGRVRPGDRLAESRLVAGLGVSRNTLREAFRVLAHERLVEHVPNRGVFVRRLSVAEAREVYRTRRILELGALRESAVRLAEGARPSESGTDVAREWADGVAAVRDAVRDGLRARDERDWAAVGSANGRFHLALAALAGNETLDRLLRALLTEMRLLFVVVAPAREVHADYLEDNVRIAGLVEAGELARAGTVLEDYLLRAERRLVGWYADRTD